MPTSHPRRLTPPPTVVSLRRWLCAWLALLIATQTIGSTLAGLRGTWHGHRPSMLASAPSTPLIRWRHATPDVHARWHASGQPHDHALTDPSVLPLGADTGTEAVAQLAAALAPGAEASRPLRDAARHVQAGAAPWAATSRAIAPPRKPPRA